MLSNVQQLDLDSSFFSEILEELYFLVNFFTTASEIDPCFRDQTSYDFFANTLRFAENSFNSRVRRDRT